MLGMRYLRAVAISAVVIVAMFTQWQGFADQPTTVRSEFSEALDNTSATRPVLHIGMSRLQFENAIGEKPYFVYGYGTELCHYQSGYKAAFVDGIMKSYGVPGENPQ
jgi:hypothetical protein